MWKTKYGIIVVLLILILLDSTLILLSAFHYLPQWIAIIVSIEVIGCFPFICTRGYSKLTVIICLFLGSLAIAWSLYSAFFSPYWNSVTFLDILGEETTLTPDSDTRLSREDVAIDLDYTIKALTRVHPACREGLPETIRNAFQQAKDSLASSMEDMTVGDEYGYIQPLLSLLHDAHTQAFIAKKNYHYAAYSNDTIQAINNIELASFSVLKQNRVSSEMPAWTLHEVDRKARSYEGLIELGLRPMQGVEIQWGSDSVTNRQTFFDKDFDISGGGKSTVLSADRNGYYRINDTTGIAYFRIENCYYYTASQKRHFNKGVASFFSEINAKNIHSAVLDLRGNPGGNPEIARQFIRYLPIEHYRICSDWIRRGPLMIGGENIVRNKKKSESTFYGDIYVLTSLSTFSGAVQFTDYLQGNNLAVVVGETPGNAINAYSNIVHFILPNSHLSLRISTTRYERTNPTINSDFILPDYPCKASNALDFALSIIRQKHGKE